MNLRVSDVKRVTLTKILPNSPTHPSLKFSLPYDISLIKSIIF